MTKLTEHVESVVRDVLGRTSLKDCMTSADVRDLVCEVRRHIETQYNAGRTTRTAELYRFLLPDSDSVDSGVDQVSIFHCSCICLYLLKS